MRPWASLNAPKYIPNQMPNSGCAPHGKSSKITFSLPLHSSFKFQLCEHNYGMSILGDVEVFTMWRLDFGSKGKNNKTSRRSKRKRRKNNQEKKERKEKYVCEGG